MRLLQVLVSTVLLLCTFTSAIVVMRSETRQRRTIRVQDGFVGGFSTDTSKKPLVPDIERGVLNSTRDGPHRQVHVASLRNKEMNRRPGNSDSSTKTDVCASRLYQVRLQYGNCSRRVRTKMCLGECTSFAFPHKNKFATRGLALQAVQSVCSCCSPVQVKTRRYDVICNANADDDKKKQSFYLPLMDSCSCRPCTQA